MPWFFYNQGSRWLMHRFSCQPRHMSKSICLGFELTEAVSLRRVKKTQIFSHLSSKCSALFLLLRASRTPGPLFHYASALRATCTAIAPSRRFPAPLHLLLLQPTIIVVSLRRSFCLRCQGVAALPLHRRGAATSSSSSTYAESWFALSGCSSSFTQSIDPILWNAESRYKL